MGTKQVQISEELYARIESERRAEETVGETTERLIGTEDLLSFAEETSDHESLDVSRIDAEMAEASERNSQEVRDDLGVE